MLSFLECVTVMISVYITLLLYVTDSYPHHVTAFT